jgi:hypothetical protein
MARLSLAAQTALWAAHRMNRIYRMENGFAGKTEFHLMVMAG